MHQQNEKMEEVKEEFYNLLAKYKSNS